VTTLKKKYWKKKNLEFFLKKEKKLIPNLNILISGKKFIT